MITSSAFAELVTDCFRPLAERYGFLECRPESRHTFLYKNGHVDLHISYDATRSHEMSIAVAPDGDCHPGFQLPEVLRAGGCPEDQVTKFSLLQTGSEQVLRQLMLECARLLQTYGHSILSGQPAAAHQLSMLRKVTSAHYTSAVVLKPVLEAADAAWQSKNYEQVVRLLTPHREILDEKHMRRLEYASR